jgi:hypothetical protein
VVFRWPSVVCDGGSRIACDPVPVQRGGPPRAAHGGVGENYFIWDRGNPRAELDSTGSNRLNEYVHGMGVDAPLARITGTSGSGTIHYYEQDALGDIMGLEGALDSSSSVPGISVVNEKSAPVSNGGSIRQAGISGMKHRLNVRRVRLIGGVATVGAQIQPQYGRVCCPSRDPFLAAKSDILGVKTGADTRFHEANRQVAVLWLPLRRMGFRGSRVQIPPSRFGLASRRGRIVSPGFFPPSLAFGSRLSGQIPPSRLQYNELRGRFRTHYPFVTRFSARQYDRTASSYPYPTRTLEQGCRTCRTRARTSYSR